MSSEDQLSETNTPENKSVMKKLLMALVVTLLVALILSVNFNLTTVQPKDLDKSQVTSLNETITPQVMVSANQNVDHAMPGAPAISIRPDIALPDSVSGSVPQSEGLSGLKLDPIVEHTPFPDIIESRQNPRIDVEGFYTHIKKVNSDISVLFNHSNFVTRELSFIKNQLSEHSKFIPSYEKTLITISEAQRDQDARLEKIEDKIAFIVNQLNAMKESTGVSITSNTKRNLSSDDTSKKLTHNSLSSSADKQIATVIPPKSVEPQLIDQLKVSFIGNSYAIVNDVKTNAFHTIVAGDTKSSLGIVNDIDMSRGEIRGVFYSGREWIIR